MPRRTGSLASAWAVAWLLIAPEPAAAQKNAFVDAFVAFHSALPGTYGDEGPQVTAMLDRMAASLDAWQLKGREARTALEARAGTTAADLALLYAEQQRLDEAIVAMQSAVAAEPRRASLHLFLGILHDAAGHPAEAEAAFTTARSLDPEDPIAAYLLAARIAERGGGDALRPLVATLMIAVDRGGAARPAKLFPDFSLIDDLSATVPIFSPAAYIEGFELMAARRFGPALEQFRASVANDRLVTGEAGRHERVIAGIAALRARRGEAAVEHLEAAVAALPDSPEAHRVLGIVYRAVGRLSDSIEQLEFSVRLAPDDERARVALGGTLAEADRLDEAERVLRETIDILPSSGRARWALGDVYHRLGRHVDAIGILESAASLPVLAGKVHLYWRIAELAYEYRADVNRVIAVLSGRARLVPNEAHAHKDLGLAYHRARRGDAALAELLMTRLLGHEDAEMFGALGQIHLNAGRLERAETMLRRAIVMDPDSAQAHYALAVTLRRLDRVAESKEHLDAFKRLQAAAFELQRRTFEVATLTHEADDLAAAGRLAEAVPIYEKAGALGGPPDIYRTLAWIYRKLGRSADAERADAIYEARKEAAPGDPR